MLIGDFMTHAYHRASHRSPSRTDDELFLFIHGLYRNNSILELAGYFGVGDFL